MTLFQVDYTATEESFVFVYISQEDSHLMNYYLDDVTITYKCSWIVQYNEYYPFGLQTAKSCTRSATTNNFLFDAGSELNATTGFYDLTYRNYDASLGRFFQVDPMAHVDHEMTPYHYATNNPMNLNDPSGVLEGSDPFLAELAGTAAVSWSTDAGMYDFGGGVEVAEAGQVRVVDQVLR